MDPSTYQRLITLTHCGDSHAASALAVEARRRNDLFDLLDALDLGPLDDALDAPLRSGPSKQAWTAFTQALSHAPALDETRRGALNIALAGWPAELRAPTHEGLKAFIETGSPPSEFHFVQRLSLARLPRRIQTQEGIQSMGQLQTRVAAVLSALLTACPAVLRIDDAHAGPRNAEGQQPWLRQILEAAPEHLSKLTLLGVAEDQLARVADWLSERPIEQLGLSLTYDDRLSLEALSRLLLQSLCPTLSALSTELFFNASAYPQAFVKLPNALRRNGLIASLRHLDTVGPTASDTPRPEARPRALFDVLQRLAPPHLESLVLPVDPVLVQHLHAEAVRLKHLKRLELLATHRPIPEFLLDDLRGALPNTEIHYRESRLAALTV